MTTLWLIQRILPSDNCEVFLMIKNMKPQSMIVFATKTKYIHPPGMFLSGNRIVPWLPMLSSVLKIFSLSSKNNPTYDYASISGDWLNCPGILFSLRNIQIELKIGANSKVLKNGPISKSWKTVWWLIALLGWGRKRGPPK